ncbi:MAG: hypothetical protein HFJ30_05235 [Clostridia bacterium]|nr:hypothetical protein [Clostridia bacterium]
MVGLYSNYYLIINTVHNLLAQMFSAVTASLGNLLLEGEKEKSYGVAKKLIFANFWLYSWAAIAIYELINPFIKMWLGEQFLFETITVITLTFNFYLQGMRRTMQVFAEAAGICYENRYVPIAEAVVNIIASIILVKLIGLPGVFIGTIISSLVLHCYSFPKYIYRPLFNQKFSKYIIENIKYLVIMIIMLIVTTLLINVIPIENNIIQILVNLLICAIIPNIILIVLYRKTEQFQYFLEIVKNFYTKIKEKGGRKWQKTKQDIQD